MTFKRAASNAWHWSVPVLLAIVLLWPLAAGAAPDNERRVALVIGIGAYDNAPHLTNPINDARAIGDALRRLKFDVTELYDADFRALNSGIRAFGIRAASADVAVVYYAGHGVQVDRENYLIPADAKLERERDLLYEAMPLDRLLGEVSQATRIGIVLLDSCRNNPFIERVSRSMSVAGRAVSTTPGMARVDNVPRNTMVVMAAKADQIAEDGSEHSPFAAALLAHLQIPGLELSLFFRSVRDTVLRATNNRQEPYVFSSLGADPFYFFPRPPNRPPEIAAITPLEVLETAGPTPLGVSQPTDPDQDPLSIRIIGMPRFGEVRIDGRAVALNAVMSADRFRTATFKPDGKTIGPAGTLDILVEDGRGGSITASLPITVRSSHHPPVLAAGPGRLQVAQQVLGIPPPVSPDGDPLTITINALPRGTVRNGAAILHPGDHVTPTELSKLTFWPEAGFTGPAGSLRYTVDNGHGGTVDGSLDIEVGAAAVAAPGGLPGPATTAATVSSETALWESLRDSSDPAEFDAFARLFPTSRYAADAKRRQMQLLAAAVAGKSRAQASSEPSHAAADPARVAEAEPPRVAAPPAQVRESSAGTGPGPTPGAAPGPSSGGPQSGGQQSGGQQSGGQQSGGQQSGQAALAMTQPDLSGVGTPPRAPSRVMTAANGPLITPTPPQARGGAADAKRFQDCPSCPMMIRIPAGGFTMGQGAREPESMPPHHVEVRAFALGQTPVTVGEWKACVAANACSFTPRMRVAEDRTPVHNISWEDIGQYMAWLTRTTGHPYRLPSEAEWEYAARGGTTTRYWWGDSVGMFLANCVDCGGSQDAYGPLPVDALQPNPFGLYGMLGGVAQWTADCWVPNYRGAPVDATPREAKSCEKRVLRGGSFRSQHDEITVTYRGNYDAPVRYLVNGFRVARDVE
ncbi:MAG TPA: SUMF1/EgtB/PvdO family nonheme iron enzyme [Rhodopila sp.]